MIGQLAVTATAVVPCLSPPWAVTEYAEASEIVTGASGHQNLPPLNDGQLAADVQVSLTKTR